MKKAINLKNICAVSEYVEKAQADVKFYKSYSRFPDDLSKAQENLEQAKKAYQDAAAPVRAVLMKCRSAPPHAISRPKIFSPQLILSRKPSASRKLSWTAYKQKSTFTPNAIRKHTNTRPNPRSFSCKTSAECGI